MRKAIVFLTLVLIFGQCTTPVKEKTTMNEGISEKMMDETMKALVTKYGESNSSMIDRGVKHAASLWRPDDGTEDNFKQFCMDYYIGDSSQKEVVFKKASGYFESLYGHYNELSLDLRKNLDLDNGPLNKIDQMFGAYSPDAHLSDDFFANKIAFIIALNFPYYTLEEKNTLGKKWNAREWAYARMGDIFTSRIPAAIQQKVNAAMTDADVYISEYNIYMGKLIDNEGKKLFPDDMVLLSHWNLRDELKSDYTDKENGTAKQKMIYEVMKRIITQEIPEKVINSADYNWDPYTNKTFKNGKEVSLQPESDTRYKMLLENFRALKAEDPYTPELNTYIKRKFSGEMEISQPEVEKLFDEYLRSPELKQLAGIVKKRLGRDLQPYDIWYDGFKARSSVSEKKLDQMTEKLYPNPKAFEKAMPEMLVKLGFDKEKAYSLASFITVDPARGSGHAWGAQMRSDKSHLRTRIPAAGMNYKGYNIAVHEFGHNVEQTISLHEVPYYMLHGVPNTAFTEALAFLFQKRDLELLGIKDEDPQVNYLKTLDICWSTYEIMGVSMVDMQVWKWMYDHPDATAEQLKEQTIAIAKDVWNTYFADTFGEKDEPILAIYSHMISYPLYLSAYSFGELIEFQLGQYMQGKNFGKQVERIFSQGRLTPQIWMKKAVGEELSTKPLLQSAAVAMKNLN